VVLAQGELGDLLGPEKERLSLRVVTDGLVQRCQVAQADGVVGVFLARRAPPDLRGLPGQWFGLRVVTQGPAPYGRAMLFSLVA
jgi:hypothetical protein